MIRSALPSLFVSSAIAFVLAGACSPKHDMPPLLPDCDAGAMCGITSTGGGVGVGTGTGGMTDGGSCGVIMYRDKNCNACVQLECCARDVTCSAKPDCVAWFQCESLCSATDAACLQACRNKWPNVVAEHDNFVGCKDMFCSTECAAADGGLSCGTPLFSSATCNACIDTNCCSENGSCAGNSDCIALLQCAAPCANDQACIMSCESLHPNGDANYRSLVQCIGASCSTQCR
jgi:hypothetical protein